MSRILVTGINSPLGQAVGRKLQAEGHIVVGTVRSSKLNTQNLPANELIALDLDNDSSFLNITGEIDRFIHIAAAYEGTPEHMLNVTSLGTLRLLNRAIHLKTKRLIHISSVGIHGLIKDKVVKENTTVRHSLPVGVAKWAAECFIANERASIESVSIRSPAIVGPHASRHFLAKIYLNMRNGRDEILVSNPDHMFNNIVHEEVIAEFVNTLLEKRSLPEYRAVPIGSTNPIPLREIIEIMAKATSYKGQINWVEPKTPPFRIDSTGAIELGYKPITTLKTVTRWMHDAKI